LITQVVEEDAADARRLGHLGEIEVGVLAFHGEDEVVGGGLELGPGEGGLDGCDDVQAFAAGELEKAFDAEVLEALADFGGGCGDGEPGEIGVGIEIEDEAVGVLEVVVGGAPGMDLEDIHLGERDDGVGGVEGDVGFGSGGGFVLDVDGLDAGREVVVDVLLEEAGLAGALWAANEREGAVGDVGEDAVGGDGVVVGELLLGEAGGGVEDLVGMGESCADGEAGRGGLPRDGFCWCGFCRDRFGGHGARGLRSGRLGFGRGQGEVLQGPGAVGGVGAGFGGFGAGALGLGSYGGGFAHDFGGGFVFTEAEEGGLADEVVGGPGGEADLGDEGGVNPEDGAGGVVGDAVEGRFGDAEFDELGEEIAAHLLGESGAGAAGVD